MENRSSVSHLSVLIVDDEKSIRGFLRTYLYGMMGITRIEEATNGVEALLCVRTHPEINLILLDLKMPTMDGLETVQEILNINPRVCIVILTGYPYYQQTVKSLDQPNVRAFLVKPPDLGDLDRVLGIASACIAKTASQAADRLDGWRRHVSRHVHSLASVSPLLRPRC